MNGSTATLEHINHSVVDGLFAEQIRGCGFEGDDSKNYWETFSNGGSVNTTSHTFSLGFSGHTTAHFAGSRANSRG